MATAIRLLALTLAFATLTGVAIAAPAAAEHFRAVFLARQNDVVMLTTGDALKVDAQCSCERSLRPGEAIYLSVDATSLAVTELRPLTADDTGLSGAIPRKYIVGDPRSIRSAAQVAAENVPIVNVKIDVTVPATTPFTDNVYLSTDRSNWNPSEILMSRVDAIHWTITYPLPQGSTLHYQFTRGSFATQERDKTGVSIAPRTVTAQGNMTTNDFVVRWADITF